MSDNKIPDDQQPMRPATRKSPSPKTAAKADMTNLQRSAPMKPASSPRVRAKLPEKSSTPSTKSSPQPPPRLGRAAASTKTSSTNTRLPPRDSSAKSPPARIAPPAGRADFWRERLTEYAKLARMHKPIGAALLLWPTWWALWLAAGDFPPWSTLFIFTLGVFLMRSAGCVINDYADRKLDPQVQRTRERPIAAGKVAPREALALFAVLLVLSFGLVLFTNLLTIKLSVIGAFLAATYPFVKRYTYLPQVYLGAAFGWSIPMAFAAVSNALPPLCWLLFVANILFSTIYDTEYAMVDRDDDIRAGAKSTAILFGDADLTIIGILMLSFIGSMALAAQRGHLHGAYFVGIAIASGLFGWQQWLMRGRDRDACFAAFRNNNWVGMALWAGIAVTLAMK